MRSPHPLHTWHLVGTPPDAVRGLDAVDAVLARRHATLLYGERCFEFTNSVEEYGDRLLRLVEVGRLVATSPVILAFVRDGYRAEERIAPCRGSTDEVALREVDAEALRSLGRALLDDATRNLDGKDGRG